MIPQDERIITTSTIASFAPFLSFDVILAIGSPSRNYVRLIARVAQCPLARSQVPVLQWPHSLDGRNKYLRLELYLSGHASMVHLSFNMCQVLECLLDAFPRGMVPRIAYVG
jgi:hypothetical protein